MLHMLRRSYKKVNGIALAVGKTTECVRNILQKYLNMNVGKTVDEVRRLHWKIECVFAK